MNANIKSVLLGLVLGIAPIVTCVAFYFVTPSLMEVNAGAVHSYAVMGLYTMGSLTVFIISIIFIVRDKPVIGAVALFAQIAQLIIAVSFLAGPGV